ncbi:ATP-binding protein [Aneurinibacillus uraniidurans]|uniref:ATP-binding protein n=1 Tax=Aneurinibacillus uraniidurans TaxID=2966586 RepID=UPI00234B5043|nr:ATP-binding protein [Aneurinibacillus sp. B1]WCN37298.1 ATP-binding protein [Aneurinibacillus sp. B1]
MKERIIENIASETGQEQFLQIIMNSIPDFVNLKDKDGRWLFANQAAIRTFRMEGDIYKGKTDVELEPYCALSYDELLHCEKTDEQAWKNGGETRFEEVFVNEDGETTIFDVIKIPIFHHNGERQFLLVISRDITIRKHAEEVIQKVHTLNIIGELAAGVAHEIRNPLTSLKGFTQLLHRDIGERKDYAQIMMEELKRIEEITTEFLMLAKPQKIKYQQENIISIINRSITLVNQQAILKNIEVELDFELNIHNIQCEANHLNQVFINVLKNAIDSMEGQGKVTVRVKVGERENVIVSVSDQGCGIPRDRIAKLGRPFYTTKEKGTGLGMMVSYNIIKNHQGDIQVESEVGKGTTFHISLPVFQNHDDLQKYRMAKARACKSSENISIDV